MRRFLAAAAFLTLIPGSANASWYEARTDHFVLTIDGTQEDARSFAERLERFDAALRRLYAVKDDPDQHLRPLAVYAFDDRLFSKTCNCVNALGVYYAGAKQSLIFSDHMPNVDKKSKEGGLSSQVILLHEYSHYFTFSNFPIAYPKWFSEGFAEFNATAEFKPDGSVLIGFPADYRADAIFNHSVSIWDLFDPENRDIGWANLDGFYGKGWLLTHYLMLGHRPGQLARYLDLINQGKTSLEAAKLAFGDLKALNAELFQYSKNKLSPELRIPPSTQPVSVALRQLSQGEAAMLPIYAQMRGGGSKAAMSALAYQAEKIAMRFPDDPIVQSERAEIDLAAEDEEVADAAADAAIRLNPNNVEPFVVKGTVAVEALSKSKSKDHAAWQAARSWFLKGNHIDPNAVMPLLGYYETFVGEGTQPPDDAVMALKRAEVLAPESPIIRAALARQMLLGGDAHSARALLAPIAYSPHAPRAKNLPLQVIEKIDAGQIDQAKQLMEDKSKRDGGKAG
jgi:hypothetical protein